MFYFQARIQTACTLIERIGRKRGELVKHMQLLCEAYIELAYVNVTHLKSQRGTPLLLTQLVVKRLTIRHSVLRVTGILFYPFPYSPNSNERLIVG